MPTVHGAFLDDIWGFDNSYFNISPREAKSMDPQQRILLTTTQRALEDAGYVGDATPSFRKASMGCYIGLATGDYTENLRDDIDVFYSPGEINIAPSKSQYKFLTSDTSNRHLESISQWENIILLQTKRSIHCHRYSLFFFGSLNLPSLPGSAKRRLYSSNRWRSQCDM